MRKSILFLTIFFVLGVSGFFIYIQLQKPAVLSTTLSARSKEFIENEKKKPENLWRSLDISNTKPKQEVLDKQRIKVGECFSLIIPFAISDMREDSKCSIYVRLASPHGNIALMQSQVGFEQTEDAPGVTFRRGKKEEYIEGKVTTKNAVFITFNNKDNTERTAFLAVEGKLLTISLLAGGEREELDKRFNQMLESVEISY